MTDIATLLTVAALAAPLGDTDAPLVHQPEANLGQIEIMEQDLAYYAVQTGRWWRFFGFKICPGTVVNLPGESQCV